MMSKLNAYRLPTGELIFDCDRKCSLRNTVRWFLFSEGFSLITALAFTLSAVVLAGAG